MWHAACRTDPNVRMISVITGRTRWSTSAPNAKMTSNRRGGAGDEVPGSPANAPSSVTCLTISPCCGLARTSVVIG
jgi:hypothetical protein